MHVLVTGATGFVGSALASVLASEHEVRAGTRTPADYDGPGTAVALDVDDPESVAAAVAGCDVAYYLVHSLGSSHLEDREAAGAERFADAARSAGARVVYLGGLGSDKSEHLASRHRVGTILRDGCDAVELRAGIVVGKGGASFEMIRQLVTRMPVIPLPRAASTATEPIALADVISFLKAASELPAGAYDIGCGEPLSFADLVKRVAGALGRRPIVSASIPLAAEWFSVAVPFVTDQWAGVARQLFESMDVESVVQDRRINGITGIEPIGLDEAIRSALADEPALRP